MIFVYYTKYPRKFVWLVKFLLCSIFFAGKKEFYFVWFVKNFVYDIYYFLDVPVLYISRSICIYEFMEKSLLNFEQI